MNRLCADYLRQVGRHLRCSRRSRNRLLRGLEEELTEVLSQEESLSQEQLYARFGAPQEVAAELQATLPPEEEQRYSRRKRCIRWIVLGICGLVILCLAGYIVHTIFTATSNIDSEIFYR